MKLYLITTGVGKHFVVSNTATEAEERLAEYFSEADYGFSRERVARSIDIVAEAADDPKFITDKCLVLPKNFKP